MIKIISHNNIPKCILRYIMMNFLDLKTIETVILNIKEMNVLDNFSKQFLAKAKKGLFWNCQKGHLDVVQWLYFSRSTDIHSTNNYAFKLACEKGRLDLAKWLYHIDIGYYLSSDTLSFFGYAFDMACINGHLDVAKWLYNLSPSGNRINIHAINKSAFGYVCANGKLDVAKWLHEVGANINGYNGNNAFTRSCTNGHLEVAKWLWSVGVNIHAYQECAFIYACMQGKLDIAKWLYSIGIDPIADTYGAFAMSCKFGHLNIMEWLHSIGASNVNAIDNRDDEYDLFSDLSREIQVWLLEHGYNY